MADNYFGITDTGRVRTNNEDAFIATTVLGGKYIAACVIDGVGGYDGGELAAALARDAILDYFTVSSGDITTMMQEAFMVADKKITAEKLLNPAFASMACVATLALVDVAAKTFSYAHVGDTRLYLFRDKSLVKISKDQSFVGYLEDNGRISEAEAMQHPKRNEINKALGFDPPLTIADIEIGTSPFLPGDTLMLCSDGLTDLVTAREMTEVLASAKPLPTKGAALVQRANDRGGKDNITVVLVRNHRKPVVQKATKPTASAPLQPILFNEPLPQKENHLTVSAKKNGTSKPFWLMGFLGLALAAIVGFIVYKNYWKISEQHTTRASHKTSTEINLQLLFDTTQAQTILLPDSVIQNPLALHDTIWIRKDSVVVHGKGMRFLKSSGFKGPAFAVAPTCKYLLLNEVSFENFELAIASAGTTIHFKNVRFINCAVTVQQQLNIAQDRPITGKFTAGFVPDSLANSIQPHQ